MNKSASKTIALTVALCACAGQVLAQQQEQQQIKQEVRQEVQQQPQQIKTHFSCSVTRNEDTGRVIYVDIGTIEIEQGKIKQFQWESALHRQTHGFDCSVDMDDDLQAEVIENGWRISLKNTAASRKKRGYDTERGKNCTIRLLRTGDEVLIKPTCPALCGSRSNFSQFTVNLKTSACSYPENP